MREDLVYIGTGNGGQSDEGAEIRLAKDSLPGVSQQEGGIADAQVLRMTYLVDVASADSLHRRREITEVIFDRESFSAMQLTSLASDSGVARQVETRVRGAGLDVRVHGDHGSDRTLTLPWGPDAVFYDSLPVWLRGLDLEKPARFAIRMLPTQTSARGRNLKLEPAIILIIGPAGPPSETSHGGLEADMHYEGKVDKLWFHPGPHHILLVWEKADGTELTLHSIGTGK